MSWRDMGYTGTRTEKREQMRHRRANDEKEAIDRELADARPCICANDAWEPHTHCIHHPGRCCHCNCPGEGQ